MKHIFINSIIFILFITVSGCATQFGKKYDRSVNVRFTSEPHYLGYYIISILENERLGNGLSTLIKNEELLKVIDKKNRITANKYWTMVRPGEYVILIDCENYIARRQVDFVAGLDQTLNCLQ